MLWEEVGNLQNHPEAKNLREKRRPVYDTVNDYLRGKSKVSVSEQSNVRVVDMPCGCPSKGAVC